jgi:hypothetical protein
MLLVYDMKGPTPLVYTDSDFAGDITTRKSTSGILTMMSGGPVFWSTKTQPVVAQSTMEAEYYALGDGIKEILWLTKFMKELPILDKNDLPLSILCDSQTAIGLSRNPQDHGRAKHIDIKMAFIKDEVARGTIDLSYVSTVHNKADILTKVLPRPRFNELKGRMNMESSKPYIYKPNLGPMRINLGQGEIYRSYVALQKDVDNIKVDNARA